MALAISQAAGRQPAGTIVAASRICTAYRDTGHIRTHSPPALTRGFFL
jgi:hypothetical protein